MKTDLKTCWWHTFATFAVAFIRPCNYVITAAAAATAADDDDDDDDDLSDVAVCLIARLLFYVIRFSWRQLLEISGES